MRSGWKRNRRGVMSRRMLEPQNLSLPVNHTVNDMGCHSDHSLSSLSHSEQDNEWIRSARVSNSGNLNWHSSLFTGRVLRRDELSVENETSISSRPIRSLREPSRSSIIHRLGPRVERSPEEIYYPENCEREEPTQIRAYCSASRSNEHDRTLMHSLHRFSTNRLVPSYQTYNTRLPFYQPGYSSPNHDSMTEPMPMPSELYVSPDCYSNSNHRQHGGGSISAEERNSIGISFDAYSPRPSQRRRSYRQTLYFPPSCSSPSRQYYMRKPRSKLRRAESFEYLPSFYEEVYYQERQIAWPDCSSSEMECYNMNNPQQRPLRQSLNYPGCSSPSLRSPQKRRWQEPPMHYKECSSGVGERQCYYQDRFSDEDFSESDIFDSEEEETSEAKSKKLVRKMWNTMVRERGILVAHEGVSSEMTREYAVYVKNILMKKAVDTRMQSQDDWKPRFMRTGLVHRSGLYQMICQDYQTLLWVLKQEIPPFNGHRFFILKRPYDWDCGPIRVNSWLPSEPNDTQGALAILDAENPGIRAHSWRLVSISQENGWRQMVADVCRESALYLEKNGWTILYWNNVLPITRMENVSNKLFATQED